MATRFWATMADVGIVVRQADSRDEFQYPEEWEEVTSMNRHANAAGIDALRAGKRMVFTTEDQSYPELRRLFA